MKKILSVLLSAMLLLLCAAPAAAEDASQSFGAYEHIFIIGVDGAGAAFDKVESPCFDQIFGEFAFRHDAHTEEITISAQNWGSILTGVDCQTHGFTNGGISSTERGSDSGNQTIFYYARQAMPTAKLVSFNNWDAINHGLIENDIAVEKYHYSTDPQVTDAIVDYLAAGNAPSMMFVQLDSVDHAAHTYGGFSQAYYDAVRTADYLVGRIYNAIVAQGLMENGLFILVADHGETTDGHGGTTKEESSAVLAVAGRTVSKTVLNESVRNRDVAAIALYALGIAEPSQFVSVVPEGLFGAVRTDVSFSEIATEAPEIEPDDAAQNPEKTPTGFWARIKAFFNKIWDFFKNLFN